MKISLVFLIFASSLFAQESHWGAPPPNSVPYFSFMLEVKPVGNGQYGYVGKYSWHNVTNRHYKIYVSDNKKDWFEIANVTNNVNPFPALYDYSFNRSNVMANMTNRAGYLLVPILN